MEKKTVLQELIEKQKEDIKAIEFEIDNAQSSIHLGVCGAVLKERKIKLVELESLLPAEKAMLEDMYNTGQYANDPPLSFETIYSQFLTQPTQNER